MRLQGFVRRGPLAGVALVAMVVVAGCGSSKPATHVSSSARARSLLRQTAVAQHRVQSGVVAATLAVTPASPAGRGNPISISLEGPFRSDGDRRLSAADLNVSISAKNRTNSLSVISIGGAGYVTTGSESYQLPGSSLQLVDSTTANGSIAPTDLTKLGIQPQAWVVHPQVVGSERIGGVATTRIYAGVDAAKLVADLGTLLPKVSSLALSSSTEQPHNQARAATQRRISREMRNPHVDLWIGSSDRILRKLILSFELPTGGARLGTGGGGARVVTLTLQYSDVNRPQTIVAPTKPHPYTAFKPKLNAIAQQLGLGTSRTPTSTVRATDTTPHKTRARPGRVPELTLSPYAQCIANAEGDITKEQKCATLSNGASKPIH